jgi:hypothetical protein
MVETFDTPILPLNPDALSGRAVAAFEAVTGYGILGLLVSSLSGIFKYNRHKSKVLEHRIFRSRQRALSRLVSEERCQQKNGKT